MEGEQGWVFQGVLSRASFRRPPLRGQETFYSVVSAYQRHLRQEEHERPLALILNVTTHSVIFSLCRL